MFQNTLQNTDLCRKDNMDNKKRNIIIFKALVCLFAPVICVVAIPEIFFLIGKILDINSPFYLIFTLILPTLALIITGIHFIVGAKYEYTHLHFLIKMKMSDKFFIETDRRIRTDKEKATITSFGILYIVAAPFAAILLYLKIKGIM